MNLVEKDIIFGGEEFLLTNQRVMYWPKENALILSDLHLGKAAHFRKHGIALPTSVSEQDLLRLRKLLAHYHPRQVIIVGDLIHAGANNEVARFGHLTSDYKEIRFILVKGNHDRYAIQQLHDLGLAAYYDELQVRNIQFSHYPLQNQFPTISGHIHPGIRIRMLNKKNLKFPCYAVTDNQLILPAFSLFAGLDTCTLPDDTVSYAIYEDGFFTVGI